MLKKFVSKEPVPKGWSGDKKYCLTDEQGNRFLLRVTPIEKYDKKMKEYELMHRVAELGVPMCDPLEFGICGEGVYSIQAWIDAPPQSNTHTVWTPDVFSAKYTPSPHPKRRKIGRPDSAAR